MANWKRLIALALSGALCLVLLAGCAGEDEAFTLSVCVGGTPESLDPIYAQMAGDQTILNHLYENLMRVAVDVSGEATVTNGMAKSVEQEENQDGTVTYTFRLRSAKWSDGLQISSTLGGAWQTPPPSPPTPPSSPMWWATRRPETPAR